MSTVAPLRRKVTRVAVGVLVRSDRRVLLADRPAGKPYAGYWEFPGGKIEPGEDVAAALARELHEELGIDIGASVPWLTFEFDYPHAHVELQFRLVRDWHGDLHAREGQRLAFFDPAGALPQPLLPAAVPALRWLLLPRTVLVTDLQRLPALRAAEDPSRAGWIGAAPMVVVHADWRGAGAEAVLADLHAEPKAEGLLLVSGAGAPCLAGADGCVFEVDAMAQALPLASRTWRGAWVGSAEELQAASALGCDFVLVRSAALAGQLRMRPAPLPAYVPSVSPSPADADFSEWPGQGLWLDLRSSTTRRC